MCLQRFSIQKIFSSAFGACVLIFFPVVVFAAAPTVVYFAPETASAALGTNLIIKFNQTVIASGGTLQGSATLKIFKNGTLVEVIGGGSGAVVVSAAIVTIDPINDLDRHSTYYIQISNDMFENAGGEQYAGISNTTTWAFKTVGGGGGGHSSNQLSSSDEPLHNSTVAPCLADVGIFVPGDTCGSNNVSSNTTPPVQDALLPAAPEKPRKTLSQELIDQKAKRAEKLMKAMSNLVAQSAVPVAQTYQNSMQERTCERVRKNFAGDQKMIDRINERLMKRFEWKCDL